MILSDAEIIQLIKKPKHSQALSKAREEEAMIKAFGTGEGLDKLIDNYGRLMVEERRPKFAETFKAHSMPLIDKVKTHFERVFEATGKLIETKFWDSEQKNDFDNYVESCYGATEGKENGLTGDDYFHKEGLDAIIFHPNKVLYLDFPALSRDEQNVFVRQSGELDPRSRPQVGSVTIEHIHDIEATIRGIEYIIIANEFKMSDGKTKVKQFFVIDDARYALFEIRGSGKDARKVLEASHEFGFCPAKHVCDEPRYKDKWQTRKSVVSDSLPDLEAFLLLCNLVKVYQWESGVPTKFEPEFKCPGKQPADSSFPGATCGGGLITWTGVRGDQEPKKLSCQICNRKSQEKFSWGKVVSVPLEFFMQDGGALASNYLSAFGNVDFDSNILTVNEASLDRMRESIEFDIMGKGQNSSKTSEARNELDVQSDVEDLKRVLGSVSSQIEKSWKWTYEKIAQARDYSAFVSATIFLGRGYLLQSKSEHQQEYADLVASGADSLLLNRKLSEIAQTSYGYDAKFIELFEMLGAIIPFRHNSDSEVQGMWDKLSANTITELGLYLRLYASTLIEQFLIENDIQIWGKQASKKTRFNQLRRWFYKKAIDIKTEELKFLGLKPADIARLEEQEEEIEVPAFEEETELEEVEETGEQEDPPEEPTTEESEENQDNNTDIED